MSSSSSEIDPALIEQARKWGIAVVVPHDPKKFYRPRIGPLACGNGTRSSLVNGSHFKNRADTCLKKFSWDK